MSIPVVDLTPRAMNGALLSGSYLGPHDVVQQGRL